MARKKFAAVVLSLGCMHASSVMALGLGELSLESFLNEPLKAQVDLLNTGGLHEDEIKIRLATREDFDKLGLERAYFLTSIKFEVDTDESGKTRIIMTSEDPVLEPYLDFIVEARWPSGRLLREYTVLIDPPVFDQSSPIISASKRVEEVEGIPAPAKKKEPAASSGTKVDVRKSTLGPGEMPQRDYNAATSTTPAPGSKYMIRRDDTLWEVAQQARPQGASVHQTMLDIQRLNPGAFIDGNINRVKAGYIVYLPDTGDISSADLATALAEVRQQNDDWREGRASHPASSGGPSLRISAEPESTEDDGSSTAAATGASTAAAMEDLEKAELDRADMEERLLSMQDQVETLQRIVSVKDEQIAALQQALSGESEAAAEDADLEVLVGEPAGSEEAGALPDDGAPATAEEAVEVAAETVETTPAAAQPAVEAAPAPAVEKAAAPQESGGMMNKLLYGLGAIVLAVLAFVFFRRRGEEEQEDSSAAVAEDAFAEVKLKEQQLEVETPEPQAEEVVEAPVAEEAVAEEEAESTRGYGEHKHDEYASDVDEVDALAEADIYIAYGRYPQAIDLLKNAIGNEPGNPAYRLKLLELHADMGDKDAALEQYGELKSINDAASLERAETLLSSVGGASAASAATAPAEEKQAPEISPIDLLSESDEPLTASFSGLEIEAAESDETVAEDLDLTADFADSELDQDVLDEELIVAAESNGFSTKLDLARAYLDMGDDDGARQILEEVAAEGTDELKTEARELLERLG